MRLFVAFAALVLALVTGASAQAQQGANSEPADPATKSRLRMEGAAGGTGARVPPEASGGASVGSGSQHRHSAPETPDTQQPLPVRDKEKSSERKEGQNKQRADAEPADPATKARLRMEGAAGGTGASIPEEANGGATAGSGHQHRN